MQKTLYGVGVGPGDPELLTLKALRTVKKCKIIAIPVSDMNYAQQLQNGKRAEIKDCLEKCAAYQILLPELPEAANKKKIYLPMPMTKEKTLLEKCHEIAADMVEQELAAGQDIAFLTLGDPSIYSTYLYVHRLIKKRGYRTEIIPGITSFCAAAARMDMGLVENKEELHVIPGSYEIEAGLKLPGTKVLMKTGKQMKYVKDIIEQQNVSASMIENCGMDGEKCYYNVEEIPEQPGYFSLLIIKEGE